VAANLLLDTRHRVYHTRKIERARRAQSDSLGDYEPPVEITPDDSHLAQVRALVEGEDDAGLDESDLAILLGTRIYEEDLRVVAKRLGLSYEAARKRRQRVEQKLRRRWSE
jgi:hypothetical protein